MCIHRFEKRTISYKSLYLGHPTREKKRYEFLYLKCVKSEPLQINFFIWDIPQVHKLIFFFLPEMCQKRPTLSEFLSLGHPTNTQIHMNSLIWILAMNKFIWIWLYESQGWKFPSKSKGWKYLSKGQNCPDTV